jgi:hypothetical protein
MVQGPKSKKGLEMAGFCSLRRFLKERFQEKGFWGRGIRGLRTLLYEY